MKWPFESKRVLMEALLLQFSIVIELIEIISSKFLIFFYKSIVWKMVKNSTVNFNLSIITGLILNCRLIQNELWWRMLIFHFPSVSKPHELIMNQIQQYFTRAWYGKFQSTRLLICAIQFKLV